jgi:hypothetical protein
MRAMQIEGKIPDQPDLACVKVAVQYRHEAVASITVEYHLREVGEIVTIAEYQELDRRVKGLIG